MSTYEAISLMLSFGVFTISPISLIVILLKDNKQGKK
ncbi:putative holin-like toxin [Irregularibacter muris]|uniref:Holin-like toxin n=1 Tax=Irregularibacter muris TaxID=1796619 RepID=A0AAE3HG99_9FIRM|nr:putative holin-like toxin [Irregularibacter muris]MCR1898489.1 putative holin-like toxin [Irregularibacter muris]